VSSRARSIGSAPTTTRSGHTGRPGAGRPKRRSKRGIRPGPRARRSASGLVRVRRDRIDKGGKVTLRHGTRLHHIGVGHAHKGKRVTLLVKGLDVRVISEDGELLRHLTLDPTRNYQPQGS
jgi:hypothetical protein